MRATAWFLDGTLKTAPDIFFQLFAILGLITQISRGREQTVALPFVYALLESKAEVAYSKVLEVVLRHAERLTIAVTLPAYAMTDFELAIINAIRRHIENVRGCFFHLRQNVYRQIQANGLQIQYNDEEDRSIKEAAQRMCALAFVPVADVIPTFDLLSEELPEDFFPISDYFEVEYQSYISS